MVVLRYTHDFLLKEINMPFKKSAISLICLFSSSVLADVSVHVLDTNLGLPGTGVEVDFYEKTGNDWELKSTQITDKNGRIAKFELGKSKEYRVIFDVENYFNSKKIDSFYKNIPVDFMISDNDEHYHIPLLLSPFAYSTYRGN